MDAMKKHGDSRLRGEQLRDKRDNEARARSKSKTVASELVFIIRLQMMYEYESNTKYILKSHAPVLEINFNLRN